MKKIRKLALIALLAVVVLSTPAAVTVPAAQAAGGMDSIACRMAAISHYTNPTLNFACEIAIAWDDWFHPWD